MFGITHEEKELPSINMSMKLQGYLLGYSIVQNGIIVKEHRYSQPVKNLVVNSGKDHLLTYSHAYAMFGYSGAITSNIANGVLSYCHRGSSSTAASVTDTALLAPIGNKTSTFIAGDPNTGTRFDRENGKVVMRVTHAHEYESSDRNINELGWFGSNLSQQYILFSRIVLPSTITVLAGQSLRTVYQLEVSITPIVSTPCAPAITGWTTDGDYRWECVFPATSTTLATHSNIALLDTISTTGTAVAPAFDTADGGGLSLYNFNALLNYKQCTLFGSATTFNTFGTGPSFTTASSTVFNIGKNASSGTSSYALQAYSNGNYYRDIALVMEPTWTGYSSISIYAMRLFGLKYIFDTPQTKTNTQRLTLTYRISVS